MVIIIMITDNTAQDNGQSRRLYNLHHCGTISISTITLLITLGILVAATMVITPNLINAGLFQQENNHKSILNAEQQRVYDILEYIFKTSYATIDIVRYGNTQNEIESIVLWVNQPGALGRLFTTDLLVIRHSRVLKCITLYQYTPADESEMLWLPSVNIDDVKNRDFIDKFIKQKNVISSTIASSVESLHLISTGSTSESAGTDQLQPTQMLELTWISNITDTVQRAMITEPLPVMK